MKRYNTFSIIRFLICCFPLSGYCQEITTDSIATYQSPNSKLIDVAYGKQSKNAITSSVSTIFSDEIENASVTTMGASLYGKLAGLYVEQPIGQPGNDSPTFRIRGAGTNTGNRNPLILVDGIERSLDQVPLSDIASVSVLKDAAALALYGVRGGNGVILATTKRGYNGKTHLTVNMEYGTQSADRLPNFISSAEYARYMNQAAANDGLSTPIYTQEQIDLFQKGNSPLYPNTNWVKELIRSNAPIWNINATASGGNRIVNYFVSLGYLRNEGIYKHTDLNEDFSTQNSYGKINFRSNIDVNINPKFKLSLDLGGYLEDVNTPGSYGSTIFSNIYGYGPHLFPMLNPNGSIGGNNTYRNNPYGLITSTGFSTQHKRNFQAQVKLRYNLDKFIKGLQIYGNVAFDNYVLYTDSKKKTFAVFSVSENEGQYTYERFGEESSLKNSTSTEQFKRWYLEGGLEYNHNFKNHAIQGLFLYQMGEYKNAELHPYRHQGFAGRIHYNYKKTYLAEFSWSATASQQTSSNNRWGFFPALSIGWIISNEDFMKNIKPLNFLKIRSSYGLTGWDSSDYGRFLFNNYFTGGSSYYFGSENTASSGLQEGNMVNNNMKWETNHTFNLGIDATFFKHLDITLDAFYARRTDIMSQISYIVPSYIGYSKGYFNYGTVDNKGIDATISWKEKIRKFSYSISLNGGFARSKIIKTGELAYRDAYRSRIGKSLAQNYGYEAIGFVTEEEASQGYSQFGSILRAGDVKYKDQNNDNIIDENDEVAIGGKWLPEITYGSNINLSYAGFNIETQFEGVANRTVNISSLAGTIGVKNQFPEIVEKSWTPETSSQAEYPRLTTQPNTNNYKASNIWLKDAGFLRLRMIEVGYNLPTKTVKNMGFGKLRFYVRGMNLLTLDKLDFFNPDIMASYPMMRSYHVGIKMEF